MRSSTRVVLTLPMLTSRIPSELDEGHDFTISILSSRVLLLQVRDILFQLLVTMMIYLVVTGIILEGVNFDLHRMDQPLSSLSFHCFENPSVRDAIQSLNVSGCEITACIHVDSRLF